MRKQNRVGAQVPTKKLPSISSVLVVPRPAGAGAFTLRERNVTFWKNARRNAGAKMYTAISHRFFTVMCDPMYKPRPIPATIKQISAQKNRGSMSLNIVDRRYVTSNPLTSCGGAAEIR
jgi:hypothetical protein